MEVPADHEDIPLPSFEVAAMTGELRDSRDRRGDAPTSAVVVLNAGVVPRHSRTTESGLDVMVHTNFVANVQLMRVRPFRPRRSSCFLNMAANFLLCRQY